MATEKMIFFHLPKTAGTSLRKVLEANFNEDELAFCYKFQGGKDEVESKLRNALRQETPLIYGHIDFRQLSAAGDWSGYKLATLLRHPVSRIVSHYIFLLNSQNEMRRREVEEMGGFEVFLDSYYGKNWFCQILAGKKKISKTVSDSTLIIEEAKQNLSKFSWIGITEFYEDSIISLKEALKLESIWKRQENVSLNSELKLNLIKEFEPEILKNNQGDLELYEMGKISFQKQIENISNLKMKRLKLQALSFMK